MASVYATLLSPPFLSTSRPFFSRSLYMKPVSFPIKCSTEPAPGVDNEIEEKGSSIFGISTSNLRATLGTLGFIETGYLTYMKLTGSEAFCTIGGGGCSDVLNSDYSLVFGVPLSAIGMVAYGSVVLLSILQMKKSVPYIVGYADASLISLGITTSMATASAYFIYLLNTNLAGSSCSYCLTSAILSFGLFLITLKEYGLENIQRSLGLQIAIAGVVVSALSGSYMNIPQTSRWIPSAKGSRTQEREDFPGQSPVLVLFSQLDGLWGWSISAHSLSLTYLKRPGLEPARSRLPAGASEITLEPYEIEITNQSTPWVISLAKHLHSIGAKMYGAFWCSHCLEQKQMFGREAMQIIDYVECFPDGAGKGKTIAKMCSDAAIEGFPTWIINNKVLSGEQELSDLAEASGFPLKDPEVAKDLSIGDAAK